jgi:hypothetical protein
VYYSINEKFPKEVGIYESFQACLTLPKYQPKELNPA